ncbi:unnamed protein product [Parascedosporium putredinis]|uniref:Ring-like domain-containing protein n=1 Tax=Parascedosporium putredinis TaxID=1442378 RepID=A0A9P1M6W0_9PEZI|nr:unnamed protein product [Parascedosporium putredinis]CAI7987747.1 unnamed protein product [Parascedosporium putredinis]
MLEYFAYKKYKKHKAEKEEKKEDKGKAKEEIVHTPGPAPALPPRIKTPEITWDSDDFNSRHSGEISDSSAIVAVSRSRDDKDKALATIPAPNPQQCNPGTPAEATKDEVAREQKDLSRVLRSLGLTTDEDDRALSLTPDVASLAKRFTLVLKDLANGVPTAYGDLVSLIEDRDGLLDRTFEKLPGPLQKLVMQMPDKITASFAPEVLKAAAAAQGKEVDVKGEGGLKDAAMSLLTVRGMQEMVTKPGAIAGMLRSIVNALKLRFPAFIGTNLLWSVSVFLLLFVLWYCYKRGREERLKKESGEAGPAVVKEGTESRLSIEEVREGESSQAGPSTLPAVNPVPTITEPEDEAAKAVAAGSSQARS